MNLSSSNLAVRFICERLSSARLFDADDLKRAMFKTVERALKEQKLSNEEARVLLKFYENGLEGYTYLE